MGDPEKTMVREVDLEIGGQKVRAKGYRLVDLIWLPMVLGISYTCLTLAQAKEEQEKTSKSVRDANIAIVQALKENNATTTRAIEALVSEQRKSTNAIREVACLNDPAMRNRGDARDFCKRMSRDDR